MDFHKGQLYVRLYDGKIAELFYPNEEIAKDYSIFEKQRIAEMSWGVAHPYFCGAFEMSHSGKKTATAILTAFRKATDADITTFLENWAVNAYVTITQWVNLVKNCKDLDTKEIRRVERLAKKYI